MDIISYLVALVETQKMVGINALGTLYKKKTPGRYDVETNSFLPPKQELAFTTVVEEEELLSNYISVQRNISVDSANHYIIEFVEQIKAQLQDHQYANFSPLGELRLINENIIFEPALNEHYNANFYGLPSVSNEQTLVKVQDEINLDTEALPQAERELEELEDLQGNNLEATSSTDEINPENNLQEELSQEHNLTDEINQEDSVQEEISHEQNLQEEISQEHNLIDEINQEDSVQKEINHEQNLQKGLSQEDNLKEEINLNTDDLPQIKREVKDQQEEFHQNPVVDIQPSIPIVNEKVITPVWTGTSDDDDDDENTGRGKRIFLKTLLVLFIILIAGAATYFLYPDLFERFQNDSSDYISEPIPVATIDTAVNKNIDSLIADSIKRNIALALQKDSLLANTPQHTIVYEVIASAMKSQKKVLEVTANLAKRGLTAKKMDALPGRLIKISVGTFTDYNLAKKFQDSLKIKLRNPDIYIQTVKPKK